jgi:hypothetical protein
LGKASEALRASELGNEQTASCDTGSDTDPGQYLASGENG